MTESSPNHGLSPERLQMFLAGLSGMDPDEVRKAKLLFLRNELAQLRAVKESYSGMNVVQGCFALIPVFWPILWAQRKAMKATLALQTEQIRNALAVWRADLGDEHDALARLLEELSAS